MKIIKILTFIAIAATVSACGDFEWFPKVVDTTPPTVSAFIAGKQIFNNGTTHVSSLTASVTFFSTEAATIYYTTNGDTPTISSNPVTVSSSSGSTGPSIIANTILKFFGIDNLSNSSAIQTGNIKSP